MGTLLEVDGVIYEELEVDVVQLYKKLYQEMEEWRPSWRVWSLIKLEGQGGDGLKTKSM